MVKGASKIRDTDFYRFLIFVWKLYSYIFERGIIKKIFRIFLFRSNPLLNDIVMYCLSHRLSIKAKHTFWKFAIVTIDLRNFSRWHDRTHGLTTSPILLWIYRVEHLPPSILHRSGCSRYVHERRDKRNVFYLLEPFPFVHLLFSSQEARQGIIRISWIAEPARRPIKFRPSRRESLG